MSRSNIAIIFIVSSQIYFWCMSIRNRVARYAIKSRLEVNNRDAALFTPLPPINLIDERRVIKSIRELHSLVRRDSFRRVSTVSQRLGLTHRKHSAHINCEHGTLYGEYSCSVFDQFIDSRAKWFNNNFLILSLLYVYLNFYNSSICFY
ncbi:hypothetical protein PUN28_010547 [Cardiocondyla obscurior]|uniref:Uncharacterized protein n=1 Tax=Cardiocondyla obscurior TaxID=286306 RepID=A0AAW2FMA1_9HYME